MVDIIFTLRNMSRKTRTPYLRHLPHSPKAFRQNHDFVAGDVIFLDCFADDFFGGAVGVDVCCVPGVDTPVVGGFEDGEGLGCIS